MSTPGTQPQAAGWYPDPAGSGGSRWHDGQGWTGQVTHGTVRPGLGQPFARMADWLGRLLGLWGVLYLLCAAVPAWLWMNPPRLPLPSTLDQPTPPATTQQLEGTPVALWILLGVCGLSLVTGVWWLVWQYHLAVSAPVALRRSPGGHVFWWFVPLANLWIPRSNIGDLWHAYGRQQRGEPADPTPVVFSVWWALWVAPVLMEPFFVLALVRATGPEGAVQAVFGYWTLALVAGACCAFCARLVVRDLSWRALLFHASLD